MSFGTVAILGPGLIGGSLALALAERKLADRLVIWGRKDTSFPAIKEKLPQATLTTDLIEAVREADVVVLCVPIETMADLVKKFADSLKSTALVTDVGSVKESVDRELAPLLAGKALWIGSHPMAGSEQAGFSAARADLFNGALVIVTPTQEKNEAYTRAVAFWKAVAQGGRIEWIEPKFHDLAVAEISHFPHFLASLLLCRLTDEGSLLLSKEKMSPASQKAFEFAGPGFRDTTRVASGSPELWVEILWANRNAISDHLGGLGSILAVVKAIFNSADSVKAKAEILEILKIAQKRRAELLELNNGAKSSS